MEFGWEGGGKREFGELAAKGCGFGGEDGGIVKGDVREAGEEIGDGADEVAESLGPENKAGRNWETGLGKTGEVGTLATGLGDLHGERIMEVQDGGHERFL